MRKRDIVVGTMKYEETVQCFTMIIESILYSSGQSGGDSSAILDRVEEETVQWKRRQSCSE